MKIQTPALRLALAAIGCVITLFAAARVPAIGSPPHGAALPDRTIYTVAAESGVPEIPFERVNNHVVLPLSVNGSEAFRVVLDTGMPASGLVLYGSERADALELDYAPMQAQVGGAGGHGAPIAARVAMEEQLGLPGLEMQRSRVLVLDTPDDFVDYHDGIVGYSLFSQFVVEIDNDRELIRLHDAESFEAPAAARELPLTLRGNMPFVEVGVTLDGEASFNADVVVDLGASHALSLNTAADERIRVPDPSLAATLGHGLSGPIDGRVARIDRLSLGGYELREVVTSFPVAEHQNPRGMDSLDGNLGNGALSRFTTIFDYEGGRMLLVPGERGDEPFEFDMSGLQIAHGGSELRIERVRADSPAAKAGLRVGDVVTHVDGRRTSRVSLKQRLRTAAPIELTLLRGGERIERRLELTRQI